MEKSYKDGFKIMDAGWGVNYPNGVFKEYFRVKSIDM